MIPNRLGFGRCTSPVLMVSAAGRWMGGITYITCTMIHGKGLHYQRRSSLGIIVLCKGTWKASTEKLSSSDQKWIGLIKGAITRTRDDGHATGTRFRDSRIEP